MRRILKIFWPNTISNKNLLERTSLGFYLKHSYEAKMQMDGTLAKNERRGNTQDSTEMDSSGCKKKRATIRNKLGIHFDLG